MIRRAIWLGLGALLGITGYRRMVRLGRALTALSARPTAGFASPGQPRERSGSLGHASLTARAARQIGSEAASFVRDVRTGMAEYLDGSGELLNRQADS